MSTRQAVMLEVISKGHTRWAATADTPDGGHRADGIIGTWMGGAISEVLKPRDFLLPWDEYTVLVEARKIEEQAIHEDIIARRNARQQRIDAVVAKVAGFGLNLDEDYYIGSYFHFSVSSMEMLMDAVAEHVYEMVRSAS